MKEKSGGKVDRKDCNESQHENELISSLKRIQKLVSNTFFANLDTLLEEMS